MFLRYYCSESCQKSHWRFHKKVCQKGQTQPTTSMSLPTADPTRRAEKISAGSGGVHAGVSKTLQQSVLTCADCQQLRSKSEFSSAQSKKPASVRRCRECAFRGEAEREVEAQERAKQPNEEALEWRIIAEMPTSDVERFARDADFVLARSREEGAAALPTQLQSPEAVTARLAQVFSPMSRQRWEAELGISEEKVGSMLEWLAPVVLQVFIAV